HVASAVCLRQLEVGGDELQCTYEPGGDSHLKRLAILLFSPNGLGGAPVDVVSGYAAHRLYVVDGPRYPLWVDGYACDRCPDRGEVTVGQRRRHDLAAGQDRQYRHDPTLDGLLVVVGEVRPGGAGDVFEALANGVGLLLVGGRDTERLWVEFGHGLGRRRWRRLCGWGGRSGWRSGRRLGRTWRSLCGDLRRRCGEAGDKGVRGALGFHSFDRRGREAEEDHALAPRHPGRHTLRRGVVPLGEAMERRVSPDHLHIEAARPGRVAEDREGVADDLLPRFAGLGRPVSHLRQQALLHRGGALCGPVRGGGGDLVERRPAGGSEVGYVCLHAL